MPGRCLVGFHGSVSSNSQVHYTVKEKRKQGANTYFDHFPIFPLVMALIHLVKFY